ncbi:aminoglycoside phosphotransferase family protein [Streptomyces sp. NPDC051776]|uniref:aminoglycoside phosphotransferase family protein n=1 Tax=Streptomyces sp. NPDC051776 TaxID=3155414 RepID=UPI0034414E4E
MSDMPRELHHLVGSVAGEFTVGEHAWGGPGGTRGWEVKGFDGRRWFARRHAEAESFDREVTAYRRWTGYLGEGHAAELAAADAETGAIVLTALPGRPLSIRKPAPEEEREAYRQAGALLARLHSAPVGATAGTGASEGAGAAGPAANAGAGPEATWAADVEEMLNGAALYLAREDEELLRAIAEEPPPSLPGVPTHSDYQPRNWLWDERQQLLRLIGFERTCVEPAARRDLAGLEYGLLQTGSGLRSAFYEGYGRELTDAERRACVSYAAVEALIALRRGIEHRDIESVERAHSMLAALRAERAEQRVWGGCAS